MCIVQCAYQRRPTLLLINLNLRTLHTGPTFWITAERLNIQKITWKFELISVLSMIEWCSYYLGNKHLSSRSISFFLIKWWILMEYFFQKAALTSNPPNLFTHIAQGNTTHLMFVGNIIIFRKIQRRIVNLSPHRRNSIENSSTKTTVHLWIARLCTSFYFCYWRMAFQLPESESYATC